MRLLVVTQYFWPESFRINDLVSELVRRGHSVTVLTGRPNYPEGKIFPDFLMTPEKYNHYCGAAVIRVPMMARGSGAFGLLLNYLSFAVSASLLGPLRFRGRNFDAVFAYEPSPITVGLPALIMRYFKRAPLIFWVQDLWPETLKAVGFVKSDFVIQAVGKLASFIYKRCDLILAQSRSFIPQIRKYAPPNAHVSYFPNWSDPRLDAAPTRMSAQLPPKVGKFDVMFAGNIGEAQDFPTILAAAERLRENGDIRWLIVGDGRMSSWVADEIVRRGLTEQMFMLGRHPSELMPSFFMGADALLVSLKDEPIFALTIPSKLQSYLDAGIPVLAVLNGEGSDLVRESGAGVSCNAGDYEALAASVLKLSGMSSSDREKMGRNGKAVSQREFNRDKLITQLEVWIEGLRFS